MDYIIKIDQIEIPEKYLKADEGYQWEANTIDSNDSGRTAMDGNLHRKIIAEKSKLYLAFSLVPASFLAQLLPALKNEFVTVTYLNPETNTMRTCQMAPSATRKCRLRLVRKDGSIYYSGLSFNLIEK